MKSLKRMIAMSLAVLMVLGTVACGSNETPSSSNSGDGTFGAAFPDVDLSNGITVTDEEVTIVIGCDPSELAGTAARCEALLDGFRAKYPNIKVQFEPMTNSDSRLMSMIAAGNGPDILRLDSYAEAPSMVARGLLIPLDPYFEAANIDTSDFTEVMNLFRYDGKTRGSGSYYGVVKDYSFDNCIWINKKTFEEAGIPIPSDTESMTYDEFAELARKLTIKNGNSVERFGFSTTQDLMRLVEPMLNSSGKSLWNAEGTKSTLTDKDTIAAFQYWADFQREGVMPSTLHPIQETDGFGSLVEGKVAMVIGGYWLGAKTTLYGDGENTDIMLLPPLKAEGGKEVNTCLFGTGLGIFSGTKHPNEAYLLMQYLMLEAEPVKTRTEYGWGIPALKSALQYLPNQTESQKQWLNVTLAQVENYSEGATVSPYLLYNSATSAFDKYYNLYLYDKAGLEETMKKIDSQLDLLVSEGQAYVQQSSQKGK